MATSRPASCSDYVPAMVFVLILALAPSCRDTSADHSAAASTPVSHTVVTPPPPPDPNIAAIAHDQALEQAATAKNDLVALYKAQADEAIHQRAVAAEAMGEWKAYGEQAQANGTKAENAVIATKARWAGGILFCAALLGIIVAVWLPLARRWSAGFAVACSVGGAVCFAFALVVPYLIWIGGAVIAAFVLAMVYWWRKDHATLGAIVTGVENAKKLLPGAASDIHTIVSQALAGGALAHVEAVGKSIGVTVTKDLATVKADAQAVAAKAAGEVTSTWP